MPEYLAPGVYVEEVAFNAKPIPGVPTAIGDDELRAIARLLRERLAPFSPQWTDPNHHDPGVTLLELFAFLGESLTYRAGHAARLAAAALALVVDKRPAQGSVLKYVRFLCGWRAWLVRSLARR
ncbi:MAG TPA: hypothetical protein VE443_08345 [Beijerinckiaceae bacterium]|jgi:hypothetical protein|nr:putative baseplate assembly protein [Microvirga sp.]HZB37994.1 hypothetical protein [Beijerinckiaceae bacterium]